MVAINYIWGGDNILMEKDDSGQTTAEYTYNPRPYGELISQRRKVGISWQTRYHEFDALGSTRVLADESGTVTDTYTYDAWGNAVAMTGASENPFRYLGSVGYFWDVELASYRVRERTYEPVISRWISTDLVSIWTNLRMYIYVHNNPPNYRDPSGLWTPYRTPAVMPSIEGRYAISPDATTEEVLYHLRKPYSHQNALDYYQKIIREMRVLGNAINQFCWLETWNCCNIAAKQYPDVDFCKGCTYNHGLLAGDLGGVDPTSSPPLQKLCTWFLREDDWRRVDDTLKRIQAYERVGFFNLDVGKPVGGGGARNFPFFPGIVIAPEYVEQVTNPEMPIRLLYHEVLHNPSFSGVFGSYHFGGFPGWSLGNLTGLWHTHIDAPLPHGRLNMMDLIDKYIRFLQLAECGPYGKSLWDQILEKVPRPRGVDE